MLEKMRACKIFMGETLIIKGYRMVTQTSPRQQSCIHQHYKRLEILHFETFHWGFCSTNEKTFLLILELNCTKKIKKFNVKQLDYDNSGKYTILMSVCFLISCLLSKVTKTNDFQAQGLRILNPRGS